MTDRHKTISLSNLEPINFCGNIVGYTAEISQFEIPFEIEPTIGKHDFNTCSGCQKSLTELICIFKVGIDGDATKKGFPFCCLPHARLVNHSKFKISDYLNVPEMVARKIIYSYQHILNNYNSVNWYKLITDYIDYAVDSFGHMPADCGESLFLGNYFNYLTSMINECAEIPLKKKTIIKDYIKAYYTTHENQKTDLNVLIATYNNWLSIFPFGLHSYFGGLKQYFEKQIPIFNGKPEKNIYSGIERVKLHSKLSLIESLVDLTNELLSQISGDKLYENGIITDANKIKIEFAINKRKLQLSEGYKNSSPDETHRYRKMIKEWFQDEEQFIEEITPLLKSSIPADQNPNIIDPIKFLDFKKSNFFSTLTKNSFTTIDAERLYQIIIESIKQLKEKRNDRILTEEFIENKLKDLFEYPTFHKTTNMWTNWLLKALKPDDSYVYAYNYLAQKENRDMGWGSNILKETTDTDLYNLLEKEKAQNQNISPDTLQSEQIIQQSTQLKLSLTDYKNKLDKTLSFYAEFSKILIAINHNDEESLIQSIILLKSLQNEINQDAALLLEQVHFDLTNEELEKYFNYGFIKIKQIIEKFNLHYAVSENWSKDDPRNSFTYKVWNRHTNAFKDHLFLSAPSDRSFLFFLNNILQSQLNDFHINFKKSNLISFPENISVLEISEDDKKLRLIYTPLDGSISGLSEPNQIINNLILLFEKFDAINFSIKNERKQEINLDVMLYSYSKDVQVLKKQILSLHLSSNNILLEKVKSELLKKRNILVGMDFGFMPPIPNSEKTKVLTDPDLIKMINDSKRLCLTELIDYIDSFEDTLLSPPLDSEKGTDSPKSEIKPVFKPEAIDTIFEILKVYFPSQNEELKQVLETGIQPLQKLIFQGSGKTLLDFFKQLMKGQYLTIAVQDDFLTWLSISFEYLHLRQPNEISKKYASTIISGNSRAAKGNRLIDVESKNGKFEIIQLEIRNREQN